MTPDISIVIPVRNGSATIAACLQAACASAHDSFEVIVVDDGSTDGTAEIARRYPVTLIALAGHKGASAARNAGASAARCSAIFFIDADCVVMPDTAMRAATAYHAHPDRITGGTYTAIPNDSGFYSAFQSIYIHHSETANMESPDYVATHSMVIGRGVFERTGGFREDFLPMIEDVDFCHRASAMGIGLRMEPGLEVRHIFNFTLWRSLRNAFRKSRYWTAYSISKGDMHRDSGTASLGLKVNGFAWIAAALCDTLAILAAFPPLYLISALAQTVNVIANRSLLARFFRAKGLGFGICASAYYLFAYPVPVLIGALAGIAGRKP